MAEQGPATANGSTPPVTPNEKMGVPQAPGPRMLGSRTLLRNLCYGLSLAWSAAPRLLCTWAVLLLIQGLLAPALLLAIRATVDAIADSAMSNGGLRSTLLRALPAAACAGAILLAGQILASFASWVRICIGEHLRDAAQARIHQQAARLDLAFYESPDSYDLLHRARVDALAMPAQLVEHLGTLGQNGIALMAIAVVLIAYASWLPLLLIGSAAPAMWVIARYTYAANALRLASTAQERRSRYLDSLLTERNAAAEVRLFDLAPHFSARFRQLRDTLRDARLQLEHRKLRAELFAASAGFAGLAAAMLWILQRVSSNAARLGDVVLFFQSFQQGQRLMRAVLDAGAGLYRGMLFLQNLRTFLELQPTLAPASAVRIPLQRLQTGVQFDMVTFNYPGTQRTALNDVTLALPAGRITAIVGDNGAGKSTLLKLLCRFFDPTAGRVLLDGEDLTSFDVQALRRAVTVLFQEPLRHHGSAGENIALGDLQAMPEQIHGAAVAAGAHAPIMRLPEGYETVLGKWFGGAELSTGEWQRVALARAFLRDSAIVALDEPTSAMDTWAEMDWLSRFRLLVAGRTTVIITHRFTTAMQADHIYVMRAGCVIESGTHQQLLALGGRYAQGWHEQVEWGSPRKTANAAR